MITLGLNHFDETGSRGDEKTAGFMLRLTRIISYLTINQKRDQTGMDVADVLSHSRASLSMPTGALTEGIRM